jgi:hypothetical protein
LRSDDFAHLSLEELFRILNNERAARKRAEEACKNIADARKRAERTFVERELVHIAKTSANSARAVLENWRKLTGVSLVSTERRSVLAHLPLSCTNDGCDDLFCQLTGMWAIAGDDSEWHATATSIKDNFVANNVVGQKMGVDLTSAVQRIVCAVLEATKEPLENLLPSGSLHLFIESHGVIKNENETATHSPYAALFVDTESVVSTYDNRARRNTCLAVEAVPFMNKKGQADVLVGAERDLVNMSGSVASAEMRVGTSVFTDGVDWYFARMAWRLLGGEWIRDIAMSPKIDINVDGGWELLARWFAFALHEAVRTPLEATGVDAYSWIVNGDDWQLVDAMSAGRRSTVARWRKVIADVETKSPNDTVVVKFIYTIADSHAASLCFELERKMLQMFADKSGFVHRHPSFPANDELYLALEDCGTPLGKSDIRGEAGCRLARVVHRDIWAGALVTLREANLCHFDITENNVIVGTDANGACAKLIDFESATKRGESAKSCPTAAIFTARPRTATFEFDEQCVCAILECLWDPAISSFGACRIALVPTFADVARRVDLIKKIVQNEK